MTQTVRVPPDSTGKRITQRGSLQIAYINRTEDLTIGSVLSTASGVLGDITKWTPATGTTGTVEIVLDVTSAESIGSAENLLVDGVISAASGAAASALYTQQIVSVGYNNPNHGQHVDNQGAASFRFSEGSPVFDAFGGTKVTDASMIGVYEFSNDPMNNLFAVDVTNGGAVNYDSVKSIVSLDCTTANGSSVARTSNKYHFYWPGVGNTIMMSVACSDAGVANNTRRWGYFDGLNGVFFELAGTTLNVVLRSYVTGSVVETRVAQADWNGDRVDGSSGGNQLSGFTLEIDKLTVYWIDYQWLGAGRVRFGVLGGNGARITCHEIRSSGANLYPYMQTGCLPVRLENANSAVLGTSPSIRTACMAVRSDGKIDYTFWRWSHNHPQVTITGDDIPVLSMRSKLTVGGKLNAINVYPEYYSCYVAGGTVRVDFAWPVTLTNEDFAEDDDTTVEFDHAATACTIDANYWQLHSVYLAAGCHEIDLAKLFDDNDEGVIRGAGVTPPQVPLTIKCTLVTGSPTIIGTLSYKELR